MDNDEALHRFEAFVRRRSPDRRTSIDYTSDIRQFHRHCSKPWDAVTVEDIDAFVDDMRQAGRKSATIRRRVVSLKVYFDFLAEEDNRPDHANPVRLQRHAGRPDHRLPRGLTDAEVERLLVLVTSARDRALVILMLRAGLRVSEVVGLTMDDIWLPVALQIPSRLRVFGKGRKERTVYLGPAATKTLVEWLEARPICETPAVFVNEHRRALSVSGVQWLLKGYGKEAGIHLTPHRLRHTCARQLIESRMPVESLAHLLGHAQISTTQIYLEGADMHLRETFAEAMERVESAVPAPKQRVGTVPEGKVTNRAGTVARLHVEPEYAPLPGRQSWATDLPEPIRTACLEYVQRQSMHWRPSQRRLHARVLLGAFALFWRWVIARRPLNRVADLAASDVQAYMQYRLDCGLTAGTVNVGLTRIHGLLRALAEQGESISPSLFRIQHVRMPDPLPRALTEEDTRRLEAQARAWLAQGTQRTVRDATCFLLLVHTGLRISELIDLRRSDLDLERRCLYVSGKGGHDRVVYLTDTLIQALQQYLALWPDNGQALLFVSAHGRRLARNTVAKWLNGLAAKAQVTHVSPHRLRHTFATRLINAGMPVTDLQKLLGHKHLSTTQVYARVYDVTVERDYQNAMARLQTETGNEEATAAPSILYRAVATVTIDNSV